MQKLDYVKVILIVILAVSSLALLLLPQTSSGIGLTFLNEEPKESSVLQPVVYIAGAINKPGVYTVDAQQRLAEVVTMAGGFSENVDKSFVNQELNLAEVVKDGEHYFVPALQADQAKVDESDKTVSGLALLDLNSATVNELQELPGIGVATAENIVQARPFTEVSDLLDVSGIGEAKLKQLEELVTVE